MTKGRNKTFAEQCRALGKPAVYVRKLQTTLDLYIPPETEGYSPEYGAFLRAIVALRTCGVAIEDIADLFRLEKKLLVMLKVDTLSESPAWYLDQCGRESSPDRLLLTNYPIDGAVSASGVQSNLDFSNRDKELFRSTEMGEDARRVLESCRKRADVIMARVESEVPVLKQALGWAAVKLTDNRSR